MNIIDIITKKKNKEELTEEEIKYVVNGFVSGDIKDYQMSALLKVLKLSILPDNIIYLVKYITSLSVISLITIAISKADI